MTDLVTDAAIDAAIRTTLLDEMGGAYADNGEYVEAILNAAAPLIAAEALRQEILRAEGDFYETWGYVDESADSVLEGLRQRVEELERDAKIQGTGQTND